MRGKIILLVLALALLCGCTQEAVPEPSAPGTAGVRLEAERLAQAQLGVLAERVSAQELERVVVLLERLVPLRQERLEADRWEKSATEERLVSRLNQLYEEYTVRYLGDGGGWGYGSPRERVLAEYYIRDGVSLEPDRSAQTEPGEDFDGADAQALWERMLSLMPEGAWADFSRFILFTDGKDETLAYVMPADDAGRRWQIAVDPADAEDWDWFCETVLHEYTHYLTLNEEQVTYTSQQTASTYNEEGMVAASGSYLDNFYQRFWADYLDDRLANRDSCNFFFRHEEDFVTLYASTDPSEDIAESFTYFILYEAQEGEAVWEQKINFFYDYPELVQFREGVRGQLEPAA